MELVNLASELVSLESHASTVCWSVRTSQSSARKGQSSVAVCLALGLVNLAFGLHGIGQSRIPCHYTAASGQVSLAPRRSSLEPGKSLLASGQVSL